MASNSTAKKVTYQNIHQYELEYASHQHWVYGFWFKNKLMRRIATRLKLNWQKRAYSASFKVIDHVMKTSGVWCDVAAVSYRGEGATIMAFVESDHRRLDRNKYSEKQMDAVRRAMGLPKGTKPKWYELCGRASDPDAEPDSDDEPFPIKEWPASKLPSASFKISDEVVEAHRKFIFERQPSSCKPAMSG